MSWNTVSLNGQNGGVGFIFQRRCYSFDEHGVRDEICLVFWKFAFTHQAAPKG